MSRRRRPPVAATPPHAEGGEKALLPVPPGAVAALVLAWTVFAAVRFHFAGVRFYPEQWGALFALYGSAPRVLAGGLARDLALAAGFWLVFATLGRAVLRRLGLPSLSRAEDLFLSSAVGAGAASLGLLALGLAGLWRPPVLAGLFFAGLAASLALRPWKHEAAASQRDSGRPGLWGWAALSLLAAAAAFNVLATACPEIFYDSLVYHLALPKLWLMNGRIAPTPENVYSGIPFVVQMFYGAALSLTGEDLAALLHCSMGLGAALGLWLWGRRFSSGRAGLLAALIFYLCPVALYSSWNCGVDLGASFFCTAAFLALSAGLDPGQKEHSARWAVCSGFLAGLAMGTKYNVFPVGVAMVAAHAWIGRRQGRPARDTLWMALAAAAALAPWFLKNAAFYGNPVYPFFHERLGWTRPADWHGFMAAAGSRSLGETFGSWEGVKSLLSFPWRVSTADWPMGDWPGPSFLLLVPWAFALRWGSSRERTLAACLAAAAFVSWCLASTIFRYLLPGLPFVALAAALAVESRVFPGWLRGLGWAAALLACAFDLQVAHRQGEIIGQWEYLAGRVDRREYLTRQRATYGLPYYAAVDHINRNLPKGAKVLFLGESRAFYMERAFLAATVFDTNPFWLAAAEASDAGELARRVRGTGTTHLLLSVRQLHYRKDSPNVFPRDAARRPVFSEFWRRHLKLVFEERGDEPENPRWLAVYEVLDVPTADPAAFPQEPIKMLLGALESDRG